METSLPRLAFIAFATRGHRMSDARERRSITSAQSQRRHRQLQQRLVGLVSDRFQFRLLARDDNYKRHEGPRITFLDSHFAYSRDTQERVLRS